MVRNVVAALGNLTARVCDVAFLERNGMRV